MVQKTTRPQAGLGGRADTGQPEVDDLLGKVEKLLQEGRPAAALALLGSCKRKSPWLANAVGVCQLRLGQAKAAVETLRGLVLSSGLILRGDVPTVFKVNFAAALLADGNLSGGLLALDEIRQGDHPAVREVRDAVGRWRAGMTFWQRLRFSLGGQPARPLVLDFPVGWL